MITEAILSVLFGIANLLISLLPNWACTIVDGTAGLSTILAYALYFFPTDVWLAGLGMGVVMMTTSMAYAIIEWVWKKIPGVD